MGLFVIDPMSRIPVYEQLIRQLERFVLTGTMQPGDQVPSVRSLSPALSINPNTISKAYGELAARGVIQAVPGRGYFICPDAKELLSELERGKLEQLRALCRELALGGVTRNEVLTSAAEGYDSAQNTLQTEERT